VKSASVRDFRSRLAELLEGDEPVIVTRHGEQVAVVYPLHDPERVPLDVRRGIVDSVARNLGLRERYKRDVDRTLIRENLRRTAEERLLQLQEMQRFATELRRAGRPR
jgi:prevent-host-death family protein